MRLMIYRAPNTSLQPVSVDNKTPSETIGYRFMLNTLQAFRDLSEGFTDANSTSWWIYDTSALTTNIPNLILQKSALGSGDEPYMQVDIQNGTHGRQYYLKGLVTCTSGRIYTIYATFTVRDPLQDVVERIIPTSVESLLSTKWGAIRFTVSGGSPATFDASSENGCTITQLTSTTVKALWDTPFDSTLYHLEVSGSGTFGNVEITRPTPDENTKTVDFIIIEVPVGTKYITFKADGTEA